MTSPGTPMQAPVVEASPRALAWDALAQELTPAKSLARIDTVTARVVTTVTVVGSILTGLGLLAASLPAWTGWARGLAIAAVIAAAAAILCALAAQMLTIRRDLNTGDIAQLKRWYQEQFRLRAYTTRTATGLLIAATVLAGAATTVVLLQPQPANSIIAVTQSRGAATTLTSAIPAGEPKATVLVEVSFRHLAPADTLTVVVSTPPGTVAARAAATPQPDGTATRNITLPDVGLNTSLEIVATAGTRECRAAISADPTAQPTVSCRDAA